MKYQTFNPKKGEKWLEIDIANLTFLHPVNDLFSYLFWKRLFTFIKAITLLPFRGK